LRCARLPSWSNLLGIAGMRLRAVLALGALSPRSRPAEPEVRGVPLPLRFASDGEERQEV